MAVGSLGLQNAVSFLISALGDVVIVRCPFLTAALRMSGSQFKVPDFLGVQGRTNPAVVLAFRQEMPDQHRELASDGDGCDVIATLGADAWPCPHTRLR
jgi:hypothetical protein